MPDVLSQNEIEALLSSLSAPEDSEAATAPAADRAALPAPPSPAMHQAKTSQVYLPLNKRRRAAAAAALSVIRYPGAQTGTVPYELYDFRRPDKLSKEHLRSLQLLHENFGNFFASSLSGYLRAQVQVDVASVEPVSYDEYLKSISTSLLNILNVSTLSGQAILELDYGILFSMIDRLLGGTGAAGKVVRDLTDIERSLAGNIVDLALRDLATAWENIHPLEIDLESTETSSQFVQIVPGNDTVVLVLFEIQIGDFRGAMSLCVPYLLIKPILSKLSAQRWLASASKRPTALFGDQLADRLRQSRVPCIARLGKTSMKVQEIADLDVGAVLPIQVPSQDEGQPGKIGMVELVIGGQVKFHGRTGLRGKTLAIQVEKVAREPLQLISNKTAS